MPAPGTAKQATLVLAMVFQIICNADEHTEQMAVANICSHSAQVHFGPVQNSSARMLNALMTRAGKRYADSSFLVQLSQSYQRRW